MSVTALPELKFSAAKQALSHVMDTVVHDHKPQVVRRGTRDSMLLVRPDDLNRWLDTFTFSFSVTSGEGDVAVVIEQVDVVGVGDTFDAALDDAVEELRVRAQSFFERSEFYSQTDRAVQFPYLLRFALTPPEGQKALLVDETCSPNELH
jgi:hypothetical protein